MADNLIKNSYIMVYFRRFPRRYRWWPVLSLLGAGALLPVLQPRLGAQPQTPSVARRPDANTDTVLPPQLATITTDTGAFAPGRRDLSRYTTLNLCLSAAELARWTANYRLHGGVKEWDYGDDTVGVGATAPLARACGARFTLATTTSRELRALFRLALFEQNAPLADAVFTKLLAQAATPEARASIRQFGFELDLEFGRLEAALAIVAQADALGSAASTEDAEYRIQLMNRAGNRFEKHIPADTAALRHEVERQVQWIEAGPADHQNMHLIETVLRNWVKVTFWEDPAAIAPLKTRIYQLVQNLLPRWKDISPVYGVASGSPDSVFNLFADGILDFQFMAGGGKEPWVTADYWFPPPGHPATDTVRPVPGKVNLICTEYAISAETLQQLLHDYGANQLDITLVHVARGYMALNTAEQQTVQHFFGSPAEEAAAWDWDVHVYHQLPVTAAVQVVRSGWLPGLDGRRLWETKAPINELFAEVNPYIKKYLKEERDRGVVADSIWGLRSGGCNIVDGTGEVVYSQPGPGSVVDALKWFMLAQQRARSSAPRTPNVSTRSGRETLLTRDPLTLQDLSR